LAVDLKLGDDEDVYISSASEWAIRLQLSCNFVADKTC